MSLRRQRERERERERERDRDRDRGRDKGREEERGGGKKSEADEIAEANALRAKLGLKPLRP